MTQVLQVYTDALAPQQAFAAEAAAEGGAMLEMLAEYKIDSAEQYSACGEILREVKAKFKFLDEERKVSVTPLNDEVKRINDWYRPALDNLKRIVTRTEQLMGIYVLRQRQDADRLALAAQAAAKAVLVTDSDIRGSMTAAKALMTESVQAAAPKVQGVSHKPVWTFVVTDPKALVRAHPELAMPDERAVAKWISEHGDKDVPVGVEVKADVRFTTRS